MWLIMGKWAFSPTDYTHSTLLNVTHFVDLQYGDVCEVQYLNNTAVPSVEFCMWQVEEHQLRVQLPDHVGTDYFEASYEICASCSSSPQSLLTTDVDFALLERTYSTEILLEGQWGWSSSSFRTIWGP